MGIGIGILLGLFVMIVGQVLSGGAVLELLQPIALFMVLLGTFAALLVSFPKKEFRSGWALLLKSLQEHPFDFEQLQQEIAQVTTLARKEGFLALDSLRTGLTSPGLSSGVKYLMDGFEQAQIRELFDSQIRVSQDRALLPGRIWEAAGAYAPTMGVIVSTLGLMRVMLNFEDPSRLGAGIAASFVGLVYGILFSNLVFLPLANRVRRQAEFQVLPLEMVKVAILGAQEGANPSLLLEKVKQMRPVGSG